jgi:hypothetical protein
MTDAERELALDIARLTVLLADIVAARCADSGQTLSALVLMRGVEILQERRLAVENETSEKDGSSPP